LGIKYLFGGQQKNGGKRSVQQFVYALNSLGNKELMLLAVFFLLQTAD
jgi:hypothetical protein